MLPHRPYLVPGITFFHSSTLRCRVLRVSVVYAVHHGNGSVRIIFVYYCCVVTINIVTVFCHSRVSSDANLKLPTWLFWSPLLTAPHRTVLPLQDDLVLEYLELAKQSPPFSRGRTSVPCLRGHMFKCLFTAMAVRTDLRARLTKARTVEDMVSPS